MSPDACAELYDRAFGDVYRYLCRAVLGDRELAEDLTQETFTSVLAAERIGHAQVQSIPWVIGVARHKLADHYRRAGSENRRIALVWAGHQDDDDLLDEVDRESPQRVVELLRGLPSDYRLVLAFRYVDELSTEEISRLLGRSLRATESLLARARRALASSQRGES